MISVFNAPLILHWLFFSFFQQSFHITSIVGACCGTECSKALPWLANIPANHTAFSAPFHCPHRYCALPICLLQSQRHWCSKCALFFFLGGEGGVPVLSEKAFFTFCVFWTLTHHHIITKRHSWLDAYCDHLDVFPQAMVPIVGWEELASSRSQPRQEVDIALKREET